MRKWRVYNLQKGCYNYSANSLERSSKWEGGIADVKHLQIKQSYEHVWAAIWTEKKRRTYVTALSAGTVNSHYKRAPIAWFHLRTSYSTVYRRYSSLAIRLGCILKNPSKEWKSHSELGVNNDMFTDLSNSIQKPHFCTNSNKFSAK